MGCPSVVGPCTEDSPTLDLDGLSAQMEEGTAALGLASSAGLEVVEERAVPVRSSRRLALTEVGSVFDKAINRKARLLDVSGPGTVKRSRGNRQRLLSKSLMCGVRLSGEEADSLLEFVSTCG